MKKGKNADDVWERGEEDSSPVPADSSDLVPVNQRAKRRHTRRRARAPFRRATPALFYITEESQRALISKVEKPAVRRIIRICRISWFNKKENFFHPKWVEESVSARCCTCELDWHIKSFINCEIHQEKVKYKETEKSGRGENWKKSPEKGYKSLRRFLIIKPKPPDALKWTRQVEKRWPW